MLMVILHFIRPSLDVTYHGTILSIHMSVRPPIPPSALPHINLWGENLGKRHITRSYGVIFFSHNVSYYNWKCFLFCLWLSLWHWFHALITRIPYQQLSIHNKQFLKLKTICIIYEIIFQGRASKLTTCGALHILLNNHEKFCDNCKFIFLPIFNAFRNYPD